MRNKPNDELIFGVQLKCDINDWDFCALDLSVNEQIAVVREIYSKMGFLTEFKIDNDIFITFLWRCQYYYSRHNNPFHNFLHGVTVCHAAYYFLNNVPQLGEIQNHQKLGFLTACLGHDLDHRGKNNAYEVSSTSRLAIRYFDNSPLENHHAATLFKILNYDDSRIFLDVADDQMAEIKKNMIENILATDMKHHMSIVADFKKKVIQGETTSRHHLSSHHRQFHRSHELLYSLRRPLWQCQEVRRGHPVVAVGEQRVLQPGTIF